MGHRVGTHTYQFGVLEEELTHAFRVEGKQLSLRKKPTGVVKLDGCLQILLCFFLAFELNIISWTHHDRLRRKK